MYEIKLSFLSCLLFSIISLGENSTSFKNDTLKIMPLGNSITAGIAVSSQNSGYRRTLYLNLLEDLYLVDLIGSEQNGLIDDFDRDHEGHGGWESRDNLDTSRSMYHHIEKFLELNTPNIILLHLGTNDLNHGNTAAEAADDLKDLLERMFAWFESRNLSFKLVLSKIIHNSNPSNELGIKISEYNSRIENLFTELSFNRGNFYLLDMENKLSYPEDLGDDLHPNDSGYEKMGTAWYEFIDSLFSSKGPMIDMKYPEGGETWIEGSLKELRWESSKIEYVKIEARSLFSKWEIIADSLTENSYAWQVNKLSNSNIDTVFLKISDIASQDHSDSLDKPIFIKKNITGVDNQNSRPNSSLILYNNFPNPFNSFTNIEYLIPERSFVTLKVYDVLGKEIKNLYKGYKEKGIHSVKFLDKNLSSGIYYIVLKSNDFLDVKKMILLK